MNTKLLEEFREVHEMFIHLVDHVADRKGYLFFWDTGYPMCSERRRQLVRVKTLNTLDVQNIQNLRNPPETLNVSSFKRDVSYTLAENDDDNRSLVLRINGVSIMGYHPAPKYHYHKEESYWFFEGIDDEYFCVKVIRDLKHILSKSVTKQEYFRGLVY